MLVLALGLAHKQVLLTCGSGHALSGPCTSLCGGFTERVDRQCMSPGGCFAHETLERATGKAIGSSGHSPVRESGCLAHRVVAFVAGVRF